MILKKNFNQEKFQVHNAVKHPSSITSLFLVYTVYIFFLIVHISRYI